MKPSYQGGGGDSTKQPKPPHGQGQLAGYNFEDFSQWQISIYLFSSFKTIYKVEELGVITQT
jgi:hypothetical protein